MKRILASDTLLFALFGVALLVGLIASCQVHSFAPFARSGAVIVAVSIAFLSRAAIVGKDLKIHVRMETGYSSLDPRHYAAAGEPVPAWLVEELRARRAVGVYGPIAGAVGTAVWGFGDLLTPFFW